MNTTNHGGQNAHLVDALAAADPSVRLRAALAVGTRPDPELTDALIDRCAVEPDFFVRDMLTWALCRLPAEITVPRLIRELGSDGSQARSQALHTLSKIGDPIAWPRSLRWCTTRTTRSRAVLGAPQWPSCRQETRARSRRSWPPNSGGANSRCSSVSVEL